MERDEFYGYDALKFTSHAQSIGDNDSGIDGNDLLNDYQKDIDKL